MCVCLVLCVFVYLCVCFCKSLHVLNGIKYDIGWNYDVYSLKFGFYYSKPLVIWVEGPISHVQEQILKSTYNVV